MAVASTTKTNSARKAHRNPQAPSNAAHAAVAPTLPSGNMRGIIYLFIILQFFTLIVSLLGNLAPSALIGRINQTLAFYTEATGQGYGGLPLELSDGERTSFPMQVQVRSRTAASGEWITLPIATSSEKMEISSQDSTVSDSLLGPRWNLLSHRLGSWASEDPEADIFAELLLACLTTAEQATGKAFQQVRLIRPHVPTYEESLYIANEQMDLPSPEVVYEAKVVRPQGRLPMLVPNQADALTTKPVPE